MSKIPQNHKNFKSQIGDNKRKDVAICKDNFSDNQF